MRALWLLLCSLTVFGLLSLRADAAIIQLNYEFDGNEPGKNFGTVELANTGGGVKVTITANTANLQGGDIQVWYFNLADSAGTLLASDFTLSDFSGVSNLAPENLTPPTLAGPNPTIVGGAGASFQWGVSFGSGGGRNGNGVLTEATFTIDTASGLNVTDFLDASPTYARNAGVEVLMAVHFQSAEVYGAGSEMVGGGTTPPHLSHHPEPATVAIWSVLMALGFGTRRLRKSRQA